MSMTFKEAKKLATVKAIADATWKRACEYDGIDPKVSFAVLSNDNPFTARHNAAVKAFFSERKRIQRNITRREHHSVLTSMGLKRVKGALGGTYYE